MIFFRRKRELLRRADAARDARKWEEARRAYEAALRRGPRMAPVWVQLGHVLREAGAIEESLAAYRQSDRLLPGVGDTHHQIARSLRALGDEAGALASYHHALSLDPNLVDAATEAHVLGRAMWNRRSGRTDGLPDRLRFINLGTTGVCNASCVHCPTNKPETAHAPRVVMPMELFRKIVDGIAALDIPVTDQIAFGLFGDGLLDPLVVERARYLRSKLPYVRLSVNTNAAAFNRARHEPLLELVSVVAVHCESLVPETYDDLMRPLRAERVIPKIEAILRTFAGKVLASVPVSQRNREELPAIRDWFVARGAVAVVFDPLSSRCVDDLSLFNALALDPQPIRCRPEILDDLIVDCDGQVLLCCQDFARKEGIGNLATTGFAEVLTSLRRREARKILAEDRHEEFSTCRHCYGDLRGQHAVH